MSSRTENNCLKCGAHSLRRFEGTGTEFSIPISVFKSAAVIYHICVECGFVELRVDDKENLPLIARRYARVD